MRIIGKLQRNLTQSSIPKDVPDNTRRANRRKTRSSWKITCLECFTACFNRTSHSPTILTPDASSDIYIRHEKADDSKGDTFGARLSTFNDKRMDGTAYYRHFLERIQPSGPADQMKIEDSDELVLVDGCFAPEFQHDEVLVWFRRVKVDGMTRLTLVIRRAPESKKWEWIETSAIFAPDQTTEEHPHIEKVKFKELKGDHFEYPKKQHLFKVPDTQKYLDVCDGRVTLETLKGDERDKTKVLWKRTIYVLDDEPHINYSAALADYAMTSYIGVKNGNIILTKEPVWFKMITIGSKIRFKLEDAYLGYDFKSNEVKVEISQCTFEELEPSKEVLKYSTHEPIDSLPDDSDTISEDKVRHRSIASSSRSISSRSSIASSVSSLNSTRSSTSASSQSSVDSDRNSILSNQTSSESGGMINELSRSCRDPADVCSETGSQMSGSSGYKSDNPTVINDNDIAKPTVMTDLTMSVDNAEDKRGTGSLSDTPGDI